MRYFVHAALLAGYLSLATASQAQMDCNVVVNSPEDQLMLAVNGADNPQDQVTALDNYAKAHSDSKFMPCVNSSYTTAYLKLNNFDKAIEYGEKDLATGKLDMNLMLNLLKAYVASGKASDTAFDLIMKAPGMVKAESNPARPPKVTDADWQKAQQELAEQMKDESAYAEYAFFQLLPRVADPKKQIQALDSFMQAYPDTSNLNQVNFQYFLAYKQANNPAQADQYGEKGIVADPKNIVLLNLVADDYASRQTNLDKAADYAKKALALAPATPKPEGLTDEQFKANQNTQLGLAHITLGYVAFLKTNQTHRVAPAIQEFKTAVDMLGGNQQLQARALFYLGYANEVLAPPNHKAAADALTRSAAISSPLQAQAQQLLAKVKSAQRH